MFKFSYAILYYSRKYLFFLLKFEYFMELSSFKQIQRIFTFYKKNFIKYFFSF